MTEAAVEEAPTQEAGKGRRGRPRSPEITSRDERVAKLLESGPKTRNEVATALDSQPSFAYLSLVRLRNAGRVERVRGEGNTHVWQLKAV